MRDTVESLNKVLKKDTIRFSTDEDATSICWSVLVGEEIDYRPTSPLDRDVGSDTLTSAGTISTCP